MKAFGSTVGDNPNLLEVKLTKIVDHVCLEDILPIVRKHPHKFMIGKEIIFSTGSIYNTIVLTENNKIRAYTIARSCDSYYAYPTANEINYPNFLFSDDLILFKFPKKLKN